MPPTYPREIILDAETEEKLKFYLREELVRHYFEREAVVDELKMWQNQYWARPTQEKRNFPFRGAANIVIPITAIAVETIFARIMTQLWAVKPFITVHSRGPFGSDIERPLENLMDFELNHNVKIRNPLGDTILEGVKFGTLIAKTGYENITRKAIRPLGQDQEEEFYVTVRRGATLDYVSQSRFLFPHTSRNVQLDAWSGEEHSNVPLRVKMMEDSGFFKKGTYEKLYAWVQQATVGTPPALGRHYEREQEREEHRESHWPRRIDWTEVWADFDVDGDGREEAIVVHFHYPSQTIMSCRYNWYEDLHRPYRTAVFQAVEGRWRGIGICKMNEQFQREITTMHRQRLDNGTMANMRMIKIHKLSGYGPNEPIFPGKMWFLEDMEHMEAVQMSEEYQSAFANEQATMVYSQQRTKVNEAMMGMPEQGTPGTATAELSRVQEGARSFDYIMQNIKGFTGEIAVDLLCNTIQFGSRYSDVIKYLEGGDKLQLLYQLPLNLVRDNLLFEIAATSQQRNRVVDRQNWVQLAQLLQQYYTSLLQLAQANPQLIPIIMMKGMSAATEAMKQILETFDVRNIDRIVVQEIEGMINGIASGGLPPTGGMPSAPQTGGAAPGMDLLSKIAQLGGGNGTPVGNRV